jgi:hypothetical protein
VAHKNIVLHQILGPVPWERFQALVEQHQSDKWVKALTTKAQLITLLFAQLKGCSGLRETVDAVNQSGSPALSSGSPSGGAQHVGGCQP